MNKGLLALAVVVIGAVIYLSQGGEEGASESSTAPAAVEVERTIGLIDDERIKAADSEPGNWLAFGRNYEEQRFSPLTQINKENVDSLGLAWFKDMNTNRA